MGLIKIHGSIPYMKSLGKHKRYLTNVGFVISMLLSSDKIKGGEISVKVNPVVTRGNLLKGELRCLTLPSPIITVKTTTSPQTSSHVPRKL